jgi:hypothetical protein
MNTSKTATAKTADKPAQYVTEKVISGKKYAVRSICTGSSKKNVRETILQLAERKAIRENGALIRTRRRRRIRARRKECKQWRKRQ